MRIFTLLPHFLKGSQEGQPEICMDRTTRINVRDFPVSRRQYLTIL
jgi:hypothetical protein